MRLLLWALMPARSRLTATLMRWGVREFDSNTCVCLKHSVTLRASPEAVVFAADPCAIFRRIVPGEVVGFRPVVAARRSQKRAVRARRDDL